MTVHDPTKQYAGDAISARDLRRRMIDRQARQRANNPLTHFLFGNRFKPPQSDGEWIRLIPGKYEGFDGGLVPFYEYIEHFNATVRRGTICSRAWKELPNGELEGSGKCIPCLELENGATNYSFRRLAGFLLLHLDWYYLIPATDKSGNPLRYTKDTKSHKAGDVILEHVHEPEAIAKLGRVQLRKGGYERVFGNLMHWGIGTNHLLVLSAKMMDLENECRCGGMLETLLWECPNCGAEVFDLTSGESDYTKKDINQMVIRPVKCSGCGASVMLDPVKECDQCKDPQPLTIWDVDLFVGREGEGTQTQLIIRKHAHRDIDARAAKLIPENTSFLERVYAGTTIEQQAKVLKVRNPFVAEDVRQHVQDYNEVVEEIIEDDLPY